MDSSFLITQALQARKMAYAPYSHFKVGAALLCADGSIYTGCNVENASYGATNCAERTAVFKAVSEGRTSFVAIAIAGGPEEEELPGQFCPPCGICRQVLQEFSDGSLRVLLAAGPYDYKEYRLSDLLPVSFS